MTTETSQTGVAQEKAETKQTQLLSTPSGKAIRNSYADDSLSLSTKPKASAEVAVQGVQETSDEQTTANLLKKRKER